MTDPKDDAELAKAIDDRTIPVGDPPEPPAASPPPDEPDEPAPPGTRPKLARNVDEFEIDVPPPEGI